MNKRFQIVFTATLIITLLSGMASVFLGSQQTLTEPQRRILENCIATWQTGCGAIFGLLGSKGTDLLE